MLLTWAENPEWIDKIESKAELPDVMIPFASLFDRNKVRFARRVIEFVEKKKGSGPVALTRVQLFEEIANQLPYLPDLRRCRPQMFRVMEAILNGAPFVDSTSLLFFLFFDSNQRW
jgi:hypothetical protein